MGKAKRAILLYLADNGECTFTQIRAHLQEQYNIRSTKDVKLHLNDLAADDRLALLEKISHGSGNANSYRIRSGFSSLKRLHDFLVGQDSVPALMKTNYFRNFTASPEFFIMIKINLLGNAMLELHRCILDDEGYIMLQSTIGDASEADRRAILEWMGRVREDDRDDSSAGRFLFILDMIRQGDLDSIHSKGRMYMQWKGVRDVRVVSDMFDALMSELIVPESQREALTAILMLSPGAFDYLLNARNNNPLFPPNVFLGYFFSQLLIPPEIKDPGVGFWHSRSSFDLETYKKYAALLPQYSPEPPILVIARSLFVADMVHGRLAVEEVPANTLRLIIS